MNAILVTLATINGCSHAFSCRAHQINAKLVRSKKKLTISFGVITATAGKVEVVVAVVADVVVTTNKKRQCCSTLY